MTDLFFRMLADRTILTTNPPIFNEGNPDLPEKILGQPGKVTEVDSLAGIREFAFQNNAGDVINALRIFQDQANKTSLSDASSGVAQPNRTATADIIAEQATRQLVGLSQFFDEKFFKDKATIRAKHILQFIDVPEKVVIEGNTNQVKMEYGIFTEKNVIGCDITEFSPKEGSEGEAYILAKLVYKMIGYQFCLKNISNRNPM